MNTEILDAPLQADAPKPPTRLAIVSSRLDFGINAFFLIVWVCGLMGGLVSEGMFWLLAIIHFLMGCYQFGSALVGAIRGQRAKLYYLIGVIFYVLLLCLVFGVMDMHQESVLFLLVGFVPLIGAIYYTKLSYDVREKLAAYD